jgi:protein TonB
MYIRAPSASLLADRGAAFTFVVVFHIALGYAFMSGLATPIITKIFEPIHVRTITEPRRPEVVPPPPQVQIQRFEVPIPEQPSGTPMEDDGIQAVAKPPAGDASSVAPAMPTAPSITPVRMDPRHPLKIGADNYPDSAVRFGQEGRCVVNLGVAADGRIVEFSLQTSTGFAVLDTACLNAVRGQRMLPALQDGKPVPSRASIPIVWRLETR